MKILWLWGALMLCQLANGQKTSTDPVFAGILRCKEDKSALANAMIYIAKPATKTYSDSKGHFNFQQLSPGKYQVRISLMGYQTITEEITVPGNAVFLLSQKETELEQVVVTAVSGSTKMKATPIAISVVSQKEMNRSSSSNIIDALLKSVPGISAITTGPNISKPFIRGLGYNRVLTLYNGMRQEGQQWGDEHGIEIDGYGIAKAEIVKGPASLMYGSDAIAGVVNLIPEIPNDSKGRIAGDLQTEYQTNNGMMGFSAGLHARNQKFYWNFRTSFKQAKDYTNAHDGAVYNTGFLEKNISLMAGWNNLKSNHQIQFNWYNNLQEIPDGSRDSVSRAFTFQTEESDKDDIRNRPLVEAANYASYQIANIHQNISHIRLYHKSDFYIGVGKINTLLGFQQNTRNEFNHPSYSNQAGLAVRLQTINYEARYQFPEFLGLQITYGFNGMYQVNKNRDATDFPIPDYRLFDIGHFLFAKKEIHQTVFTAGIRWDYRHIQWNDFYTRKNSSTGFYQQTVVPDTAGAILNFAAYQKTFSGFSGSLGLVHNFSSAVMLKANLASGYRSPSIPEIGSDGLDPGAHIYYIGNRAFKPEINLQADLGLFYTATDWDAHVELFSNRIYQYIFFRKLFDANGLPLEIIPGNFTYQYQQGSAWLYGAEASINVHPVKLPWLSFQQHIAVINGINTNPLTRKDFGNQAKYLPLIPPLKSFQRLRINMQRPFKKFTDLFFQTEIEIAAAQKRFYAVDQTETATAGYTLINLSTGFSLINIKGRDWCKFFISANNIFNLPYQSHQNRLKYFEYYNRQPNENSGIYNMGRNLSMKIIFSWQ